ncbi:hypothetical protein [Haloarchaeobius sp. FL176]|nr:hypothetical protein [Haloarchaeobius sp. FL176]
MTDINEPWVNLTSPTVNNVVEDISGIEREGDDGDDVTPRPE